MTQGRNTRGVPDLDRVRAETFLRAVEYHPVIESTNDRGLVLARTPELETPLLILAGHQTAGRGRAGNRWWSRDGALTFSLVLSGDDVPFPPDQWPKVALLTGLALREALLPLCGASKVQVKWPNDVLIAGRKVAGILVEVPDQRLRRLVVGIGVNVNNSLREAPAEFRDGAVSLADIAGGERDPTGILIAILHRLAAQYAPQTREALAERWSPACALSGRLVSVESAGHLTTGICTGIDESGALLLETETGRTRIASGTVRRWE